MKKETKLLNEFFEYLRARPTNPIEYQQIGNLLSPTENAEDVRKTTNLVYEITDGRKKGKPSKDFNNRVKEVFKDDWNAFIESRPENAKRDYEKRLLETIFALNENLSLCMKNAESLKKENDKLKKEIEKLRG